MAPEAREDRGDHPGEPGQPADGDPEERRPLLRVGGGAHRDAEVRAHQEPPERDPGGDGDERPPRGGRRRTRAGRSAVSKVNGRVEGGERPEVVEEVGQEDLGRAEHLGQADGGDRDDEPRGGEQAAHDGGVDEQAGERRHREAERSGDEVGEPPAGDEDDRGRRAASPPISAWAKLMIRLDR